MTILISHFIPKMRGVPESLSLLPYTRTICVANKKVGSALVTGDFYRDMPDIAEYYLDVKFCDNREGISRPELGKWSTDYRWNKEAGEIELITPEEAPTAPPPREYSKGCRAALLALFSREENITEEEYSLAIDLINDNEPSFERELYEAINHTPAALALLAERQAELLTSIRRDVKETAQWTVIKKHIDRWLNTPAEKRESPAPTERKGPFYFRNPATGESGELFIFSKLAELCAKGCIEINKIEFLQLKEESLKKALGANNEDASKQSPKSSTDVLDNDNAENSGLAENTSETGEPTQEVKPGRTIFNVDELINAPATDTREQLNERQVEICHVINDLLSGSTSVIGKEEAENVIATTRHSGAEIFPLLVADIESAEFLISPDLSDDEIHRVTTTLLYSWNSDVSVRQKIALDEAVHWRKERAEAKKLKANEPAPVVIDLPIVSEQPASATLTFQQQLLLAAVQGLCANPAHATSFKDIPHMASAIADAVTTENTPCTE